MSSQRLWRPAAAACALAIGLGLGSAAEARDLTVVSWGGSYQDAQREIYFEPFKQETGINLIEESWDGGVGVIRARVEGGSAGWDVVQVEVEELVLGCEEGLYELFDWSIVGGEDSFIPAAVHECGVGTIVWSTALSYDNSRLQEAPQSWADFWDVERFPGMRGLRRGPKFALEFALMADGVPPEEVYEVLRTPEGVDRAFAKLDELRPHVIWWESGAQPPQLLASGEVVMTAAYNGRIDAANRNDGRDFGVVWPGSIYSVDSWVILRDSPNMEEAKEFIAFASQPQRQALLPRYIAYGPTHKDAVAEVEAELQADLPTAPENLAGALAVDGEFWVENIDRLTERFNNWAAR